MRGTLGIEYANQRDTKKSLKYRLWRRTFEVISAINNYVVSGKTTILDLGTADGRMLQKIKNQYPESKCFGIEYNKELAQFAHKNYPGLVILQGDIQFIDYPDNFFDVAIATAVIEHVPEPAKAISEAKRVLKPGGIIILSTPDPFWEHIASKIGLLNPEQHNEVMKLKQLCSLIQSAGFEVIDVYKFMLSPMGMPFEFIIEKWLRKIKLDCLMANQFVVGRS